MSSHIYCLLHPSFVKFSNHTAWICRQSSTRKRIVSYAEIHECTLDQASRLREQGVGKGDMIGIMAPNGPEWTVAALAIWKLDAIVAPVHIDNSELEIKQQLDAVQPKFVLTHEAKIKIDNSLSIEMQPDAERVAVERDHMPENDNAHEAVRIYTSGSTGNPKMVMLSHNNIASNVQAICSFERLDDKDSLLALLPFSHCMGLTVTLAVPLYIGARIVLPRVLAANEVMAAIEQEKISILIAVPRLYRNIMLGLQKRFEAGGMLQGVFIGLIRKSPYALKQLLNSPIRKKFGGDVKLWFSGGSRLDPKITQFFRELGLPLRQGYGLTETSPVVSAQAGLTARIDSVGQCLDGIEAKIHAADGDGQGELWIRGPNVMLGYTDDEKTDEVIKDGWFKTGDLARIDSQGNILLTGRSKRLIVTEAGKNVYPEDLEIQLERYPEIKEAGVFELEMRPAAVLAIEGDNKVEVAKEVIKKYNKVMSGHNQITKYALVDELPRTPLGKIALKNLPDVYAQWALAQ